MTIIREEFGKGNDFCKKITYRTTGEKPEDLIARFRNSYNPRIAVTVDMISTGSDFRPLECLIFMRDIRSRTYFEQMKGRGTRIIKSDDLRAVTPDATTKTHFVIIDAVGVCESDKTDSKPLERKRTTPFENLLNSVAFGVRDDDTISSLAGRLARVGQSADAEDQERLTKAAGGKQLTTVVNDLLNAIDLDMQIERAKLKFSTGAPDEKQIEKAAMELKNEACTVFDIPEFRNTILDVKRKNEQTIDTITKDRVTFAGFDEKAREKAQTVVTNFREFIAQHKDEITALQILYNRPYGQRKLTVETLNELRDQLLAADRNLSPEVLWMAYDRLEKGKVKGVGTQRFATDLVSLVATPPVRPTFWNHSPRSSTSASSNG